MFARHGILEVLRSDNGPQFASKEFADFAKAYGFQHITSSPKYPQSNGQAERMVQTIKAMLKRPGDPQLAMLSYRATPLPWCGLSPAELCMGRKIRSTVPQIQSLLTPNWPYLSAFKKAHLLYKEKQKLNFDKSHRVKDQSDAPIGSEVVITTDDSPVGGRVIAPANTPRSYIVETPSGELRRNRSQFNVLPEQPPDNPVGEPDSAVVPPEPTEPRRIVTRSQTGTAIRPPNTL